MRNDKLCEAAAEKYYRCIYLYCLSLLNNDILAAEDCTQDVFALLVQKKDKLDFHDNIRGWLYATADRICKKYYAQETKRTAFILTSIDEIIDLPDSSASLDTDSYFDMLSKEELDLLKDYYSENYGSRSRIAEKYGMKHTQLAKAIHTIRKKLKKYYKNKE